MFKIILGVLLVTVIALIVFISIDPNIAANSLTQSSLVTEGLSVSITGMIRRSGNYAMEKNSTLDDLIEKAGGVTDNADGRCYFVDIPLLNTISYYIAPINAEDDICGDYPYVKVGLNSGTNEDLLTLSGVGQTIASAIIGYREEKGPFNYLEQLKEVSGIGNATFEKLKNYITLQ